MSDDNTSKEKKLEYIGLLVFWEAIDMITDWILYSDVKSVEPGLVYGPPDESLIKALLAFSVIGTLTFIAQIAVLLIEFFKKDWIEKKGSAAKFVYDCDLVSILTIILEDFPQAVITLTLVTCREEGISYVQIAKAILPIVEIIFRITFSCIKLCRNQSRNEGKIFERIFGKTKYEKWVNSFSFIRVVGLGVVFILNVVMLILTTTEKDVDQYGNTQTSLKGREFKYIFDEEYNDNRYLENVGLYLYLPDFGFGNASSEHLIHLISIYDLENADVAEFRILIDTETKSRFVIEKSTCRDPFPKLSECFEKRENDNVHALSNCNKLLTNFTTFSFRFEFQERKIPNLILGDVSFNWKSDASGYCSKDIGNYTDVPLVHYYRSKPGINTDHHLNWVSNITRFFNIDDLIDVKYIWKTSFSSCQSKGRTAPKLDENIRLNCAS